MKTGSFVRVVTHSAPGELRVVILGQDDRPCRLYLERWQGAGEPARFGQIKQARIRAFAEQQGGAFLELESGEEAFLRLKTRQGYTEGQSLPVQIQSEARQDKLARVRITDQTSVNETGLAAWLSRIPGGKALPQTEDPNTVSAAFEGALASSVTLPNGGQIHVDRVRALSAFDIDTSGRISKGSAAARALTINREAVTEMARQVSLRGLGGNLVLDCVAPLNRDASEKIRQTAIEAFEGLGIDGATVLRPSALGLLEASIPWRFTPIEDRLAADPAETDLLALFRDVQREATANPTMLFTLKLCKPTRQAYLNRKSEADAALKKHFGGRVIIADEAADKDEVTKR